MQIIIDKNKILLAYEKEDTPYLVLEKPEIDDYSNVTARPLVTNYHLVEETIWERSCRLVEDLQAARTESSSLICCTLLFAELYPILLSSSQIKNIICYGMPGDGQTTSIFQNFMTFLQNGSSFITLPANSFVFSSILNKSCTAAVVSLDECSSFQIICDAISKIRNGGKLLLYTKAGSNPNELSSLIHFDKKREFESCAIYSVTIDNQISTLAFENNSESVIMPSLNGLLNKFEQLRELTSAINDQANLQLEVYPYAIELLEQIETALLDLYDVLENPKLPILANSMKEGLMDCYISASNRLDMQSYYSRLLSQTQAFYNGMLAEFG